MPWGISDRPFAIASPPLLTQVKTDATSLDQLKSRSSAERTRSLDGVIRNKETIPSPYHLQSQKQMLPQQIPNSLVILLFWFALGSPFCGCSHKIASDWGEKSCQDSKRERAPTNSPVDSAIRTSHAFQAKGDGTNHCAQHH